MQNNNLNIQDDTRASYTIKIDGKEYTSVTAEPTGRELLAYVHKDAATHFIVQYLPEADDIVIKADDTADLRLPGTEYFYVVSSERHFVIYIDEKRFVLTDPVPTGGFLLGLRQKKPCQYALVNIIPHADDQFIDVEEQVDLQKPGSERFITVQKDEVVIFVEHDDVQQNVVVCRGEVAVSTIKANAHIPDGYTLYETENGHVSPLADNARIPVEGCEKFVTQVNQGSSS